MASKVRSTPSEEQQFFNISRYSTEYKTPRVGKDRIYF
jgi:hypothetical protein